MDEPWGICCDDTGKNDHVMAAPHFVNNNCSAIVLQQSRCIRDTPTQNSDIPGYTRTVLKYLAALSINNACGISWGHGLVGNDHQPSWRSCLGGLEIPQLGIVRVLEQRYTRVSNSGTRILCIPKHSYCRGYMFSIWVLTKRWSTIVSQRSREYQKYPKLSLFKAQTSYLPEYIMTSLEY